MSPVGLYFCFLEYSSCTQRYSLRISGH